MTDNNIRWRAYNASTELIQWWARAHVTLEDEGYFVNCWSVAKPRFNNPKVNSHLIHRCHTRSQFMSIFFTQVELCCTTN